MVQNFEKSGKKWSKILKMGEKMVQNFENSGKIWYVHTQTTYRHGYSMVKIRLAQQVPHHLLEFLLVDKITYMKFPVCPPSSGPGRGWDLYSVLQSCLQGHLQYVLESFPYLYHNKYKRKYKQNQIRLPHFCYDKLKKKKS